MPEMTGEQRFRPSPIIGRTPWALCHGTPPPPRAASARDGAGRLHGRTQRAATQGAGRLVAERPEALIDREKEHVRGSLRAPSGAGGQRSIGAGISASDLDSTIQAVRKTQGPGVRGIPTPVVQDRSRAEGTIRHHSGVLSGRH